MSDVGLGQDAIENPPKTLVFIRFWEALCRWRPLEKPMIFQCFFRNFCDFCKTIKKNIGFSMVLSSKTIKKPMVFHRFRGLALVAPALAGTRTHADRPL